MNRVLQHEEQDILTNSKNDTIAACKIIHLTFIWHIHMVVVYQVAKSR